MLQRSHLLAAALALSALLLLAGGGFYYHKQKEHYKKMAEKNLSSIATFKIEKIVAWRKERKADATVLQENMFLMSKISRLINFPSTELKKEILHYFRALKENYGYSDVIFSDMNGQILLSTNNKTGILSQTVVQDSTTATDTERSVLVDLHTDNLDTQPHVSLLVPALVKEGQTRKPFGFLVMTMDSSKFLFPLIQSWPTLSKTAETLLVRRDNDDVLFLNPLRHMQDTALKLRVPLSRSDLPAAMAIQGKKGITKGRDYRGVEVISFISSVPDSPWFIVAKQDSAELYAQMHDASFKIFLILFLFFIFIIAFGLFLLQQEKKNYYKKLFWAESSKRELEKRYSVILESMGDAVIVVDATGTVDFMNTAAEQLTRWEKHEARGKPLGDVFNIINLKTRKPVENPVSRVLHEGKIVGLANDTTLIARDGTEFIIADSAAPVFDEQGNYLSVVMVFRDETEKYFLQKSLLESEESYRLLFSENVSGFALHEMIYNEKKQPVDYRFLMVNPAFEKLTGLNKSHIIGKTAREVLPGIEQSWIEQYGKVALSGNPAEFESYSRELGRYYQVKAYSPRKDQFAVLFSDITKEKENEKKLHENEILFRTLFDSIPSGCVIYDVRNEGAKATDYLIKKINIQSQRMEGFSKEEALGKSVLELHPNIDEYGLIPVFQKVWRTGASVHVPPKLYPDDKHANWYENRIFKLPSGELVVVYDDVTEKALQTKKIEDLQARLTYALEATTDGLWDWDAKTGRTYFSPRWYTMLGYTPNALPERYETWFDLLHPDDKDSAVSILNENLKTSKSFSFEFRMRRKTGGWAWIQSRGKVISRDEAGLPVRVVGTHTEITERKRWEQALAESESRFKALFNSVNDIVWVSSADGSKFNYLNPVAETVFGKPLDELYADPGFWIEMVHPEDKELAEATAVRLRKEGRAQGEYRIIRPDQTVRWLFERKSIISNDQGEIIALGGVATDETERKKMEFNAALSQKMESIGQLAAGIAHEINTPAQYIHSNVEYLEKSFRLLDIAIQKRQQLLDEIKFDDFSGPVYQKYKNIRQDTSLTYHLQEAPNALKGCIDGVKRISAIVNSMRYFGHPGKKEKTSLNVNEAITHAITVSQNEWKYYADIEKHLDPSLPPLHCYATEFNQVLLNIIVNAAQAIAESIGKTPSKKGIIRITSRSKGEIIEVSVQDTGVGIPEDIQGKIFDPFFTTKDVGQGTGQGLAIAHSVIVDKHAGTIDVESTPGQGTTFIIRLPKNDSKKMNEIPEGEK